MGQEVVGVLSLLVGLAVTAMGLAALVDRRVRRGTIAAFSGIALVLVGAWLVGAFG